MKTANQTCLRWIVFLAAIMGASLSRAQTPSPAAYADFAMNHKGDAAKGRLLFNNEKIACAKCHTVDGSGLRAGPDLAAIGKKFTRRDLIRSVLEPSATIAVGYSTTVIETKAGETYQGIIKQVDDGSVALMGADGKLTRFQTSDIQQQHSSPVSLMPEGLENGMSLADFSNLIAYLSSLAATFTSPDNAGVTTSIQPSVKAASFPVFFATNIMFKAPVWFGQVPGQSNRFMVLEHGGKIWLVTRTENKDEQSLLVDLSPNIHWAPASGLLGMAFHPNFINNHKYYLQYQVENAGKFSTLISQRTLSPDGKHDSSEAMTVFEIPASTEDHTGGCIQFGPDNFLYISMGDTGPQKDPEGHGQDLSLLKAKMLRIDVDKPSGTNRYGIPRDNPYLKNPRIRPEIWATGFREPWRFSFDRVTGDLWEGDVGQDKFEEVNIVRKGENYGWNVLEGHAPFSEKYHRPDTHFTPPVFCYPHTVGVSITGGYVYRGKNAPQFYGRYICADFQLQKVWALTQANRALQSVVEIGIAPSRVSSISEDAAGELYLVGYDSGRIYRVDLADADPTPVPAQSQAAK